MQLIVNLQNLFDWYIRYDLRVVLNHRVVQDWEENQFLKGVLSQWNLKITLGSLIINSQSISSRICIFIVNVVSSLS